LLLVSASGGKRYTYYYTEGVIANTAVATAANGLPNGLIAVNFNLPGPLPYGRASGPTADGYDDNSVFLPVIGWAGRAVGWLRRAGGALRSIIAGERAVALADDAYTTFYTVQDAQDIARLRGTGEPWPTDPMRSGLGEGVYAWATSSEAEAYLALRSRTVEGLRIVSFRVSNARLTAYRRLVVDSLPDADAWMERYSKVWGGVPDHGSEYIQRGTRVGVEHFFDKSIFGDLEFS
jgi:hypothetical protein